MPKYTLNGKTYNIPEQLVGKFERQNPGASRLYVYDDSPGRSDGADVASVSDGLNRSNGVNELNGGTRAGRSRTIGREDTIGSGGYDWRHQMMSDNAAMVGKSRQQVQRTSRQVEYNKAKIPLSVAPVNIGQNKGVVEESTGRWDIEKGAPEKRYLTSSGSEYSGRGGADLEENVKALQEYEQTVPGQLAAAYAERDRLNEEMGKLQGQWVDADGRVHYGDRGRDESMQALQAAYRKNEDLIKALTYEKDNAGFWQHTGTELSDLSGWNAFNAMEDAAALLRTKQKIDSGQSLGASDRLLLANTLLSQSAHAKYDENRRAAFRWGGIAAESIKLMPDFVLGMGPMKGIVGEAVKGTGKVMAKTIGKKASESVAGKILSKTVGVGLGALAGGGAMVNTVQLPRLGSETMGNMTGELIQDEQGNYKFGRFEKDANGKVQFVEDTDGFLPSLLKAEQSLIPEAASEATGEFLPGAGSLLEKIGLKKIAGGLSRLQGTKWYRNYSTALAHTGFHGAPGEMFEEYLGDVYSAVLGDLSGIVGDENGKGGWGDLDKHIDIAMGTATLGALLHAPSLANTGRHGAQYFYYRHNVNKSDNAARTVLGDFWSTFKRGIDNTTNETISDVVNGMLKDRNLSTDQKQAVFDYAINLQKQRGHLLAIMAANQEEKDEPGRAAEVLDNSYAAGYEADSPEEKQAINETLTLAEQSLDALGGGFASWVKSEDNPPMAVLSYMMSHRDTYSDEQISAAANYYQTKFAADGMAQAESDKTELEGEQSAKPLYTTLESAAGGVNGLNGVNGFVVRSFDKDGNLLGEQTFGTEEEAEAYRGEVKMRKQHQDLADLFNSPRVSMEALSAFESEQGWEPGTVEYLLNSDPMQMSDAEWSVVDAAMQFMQEKVYPSGEVHTDFNRQVGAESADDAQIDTDSPNAEAVSSVVAPYIEAKDNLTRLFNHNEELAEEVQFYEQMGKSEQEIISMLDTFPPSDVQTVIDFYNAQARFEGFMNRAQDKIEERVRMERGRRTFKGTINGQADQQNLVEITDGANTYTLVSGNITVNSDGTVTGSDSGLLLALDQNGDIIQLGDDTSLSVLPQQTTMDMWEDAFRQQMQENASAVIDPNGALGQEHAVSQQPLGQDGGYTLSKKTAKNGEQFYEDANGNIDLVDIPQEVFDAIGYTKAPLRLTESMVKHVLEHHGRELGISSEQEAIGFITDVMTHFDHVRLGDNGTLIFSIENGRDRTGKRAITILINSDYGEFYGIKTSGYEVMRKLSKRPLLWEGGVTGVPSTDAASATVPSLDDQQSGGQSGNASDQSNPLSAGKGTENSDTNQVIDVKVDENGVKLYEEGTPIDDAIADIISDGLDVGEVADASIAEAQAVIDNINGKETKTRKDLLDKKKAQDVIDYYTQLKERAALIAQRTEQESEENINVELEPAQSAGKVVPSQPKLTVEEQKQERIKALKAELGEFFDDDFTKANDVYELVSMWVGRKRNLAWDDVNGKRGLQQELGWTRRIGGDTKYIETLLAKKGEGMGVDDFVHMVWESPENDVNGEKRWDDTEIKQALLDLIQSARSKSDIKDYALNSREQIARQIKEQQEQVWEDSGNEAHYPAFVPPTEEELARMEANLPFGPPTDEDFPDSPITLLMKAVEELRQQEGMPEIKLVDTDRMSGDEWYDVASIMYDGAFVSQEEIDFVRGSVLRDGLYIIEESGAITVYSDSQTPEEVKYKVEYINNQNNGRSNEEETGGLEPQDLQRPEAGVPAIQSAAAPAAEGAEGTGSTQSVDEYLNPRDAAEEQIIADVEAQLQRDIQAAADEVRSAKSALEKVQVRESTRATDMFGNDNAFNEDGQLFDNSDMPIDQSVEGVNRRTKNERERLMEAEAKLENLQSEAERNSRVRGALDNHRRQTEIDGLSVANGSANATDRSIEDIISSMKEQAEVAPEIELTTSNWTSEFGEDGKVNTPIGEVTMGENQYFKLAQQGREGKLGMVKPTLENPDVIVEEEREAKDGRQERPTSFVFVKAFTKSDGSRYYYFTSVTVSKDGHEVVISNQEKSENRISRLLQQGKITWINPKFSSHPNTRIGESVPVNDSNSPTFTDNQAALLGINSSELSEAKGSENSDTRQENREEIGKINTSDPIEAIEQSADQFRHAQEEKKAYGKDNKLVSQDRYEELKKRMKQKLLGQLNAGFDPEIISIGAEMAMFHVEAGARKFADFAQRMIADLGDAIRPYLQGIYESAKRMPGMEELRNEMDSTETVDNFDVQNFDKSADDSVNEHKNSGNYSGKSLSLHEKESRDVFVTAVKDAMIGALRTGEKPFKSINDLRTIATQSGMTIDKDGRYDILLQELTELALVSAARETITKKHNGGFTRAAYKDIVKLYKMQPAINQRSSNRIKMQQYSTPLPMSFVAQAWIDGVNRSNGFDGSVLEPTAGNGMLVFGIDPQKVTVNELDGTRLANLQEQGFGKVMNQDATEPFDGEEQYDSVIANPPFGSAEAKEYDGKMIPGLAEQIALNALSKMKDNGRGAIIIGGNTEWAENGAIKNQKAFMTYLYDHYNVKGVIDMDGSLYARQGTTYPTRMILIDGRRSEEERAQTKVYPPVKDKAPRKAETFSDLYDIAEEINNNENKTNGNEVLRTSGPSGLSDSSNTRGQADTKRRSEQSDANGTDEQSGDTRRTGGTGTTRTDGKRAVQQPAGVVSGQTGTGGLSAISGQQSPTNRGRTGADNGQGRTVGDTRRNEPARPGAEQAGQQRNEGVEAALVAQPTEQKEEKRELNTDKLPYRPHNGAFSLESVAPAAMVEAMDKTLQNIEKEYGNIDSFVTSELGYDTIEDMHNALAAEQVDSVAMAIWNMKNGEGMVIGDQTGVGKGRQMAALIRWAVRQGKKPIFVTKDADLFSDIYRDLVDIGSGDLRPFIFNAGVTITDANGVVMHKSLSDATQKKVLAMNELPDGFDFAILSYPQMNTGDAISQEESGKTAKERGERGKKGKAVKAGRPTPKADFLRRIAKDNYLLMDESQNAAGSGNTGAYFQSILKDARAVTFASATFAKRPDTMPLYAIRTAISKAKVKTWELLQMITKGGVTLQEIMSRAMTTAGQMVRRERDMSDVRTDWKTINDPETAQKARRGYDNVMRAFNAIIDFQTNVIRPILEAKSAEFAVMATTVSERRGTKNAGVDNPPFVNRLYNFSKQLLLSLKVDAVVNEVLAEIEAGHRPVIALENTLESALEEYGIGDTIDDPTLFGKLKKGLDACFRYTLKDEDGNETGGVLQPYELGEEGEQAYNELVELIEESTRGMFISPLDAITEKLESKGVKVGEISGRKTRAVLNDNGEYEVRKRENTDRKKLARDFNSGDLDVLIINKTGSTGISLHASSRFKDQRQRTMIMAQPLSDINDYMQMIGRIDRTGQVHRGYYINLGLPVPAETRFMMMLANKLKSLNANTTTSQENKDNDVEAPDLLNKYGDQVMIEYLRDNPDVYRKLGEFLKGKAEPGAQTVTADKLDEYKVKEGDARQITGRVALLSVDEQDAFYDDVTRRYNELIKYLNDTNSNDLKITVMPLRARTIDKQVSSEGTAPNSNNPFADNAYVEWVEMDILKKPMKAEEVGKTIEQLNPGIEDEGNGSNGVNGLNGVTQRVQQIIGTVEKETQEKMDKEAARYDAAKSRAEDDIAAKTETINAQERRTREQKDEAIKKYADDKRHAVEEIHQRAVDKIRANRNRLVNTLKMFKVGDSVLIPDDLTTDTFLGSVSGIFCGFKAKNENITQSTTLAVFCTLDGRRKIEVKLSDWSALMRIDRMTQDNWDAAHGVTLSNWDSQIPTSSRKRGYIMTGNILQAISDTKVGESFVGQLVTFTDDKGNVRDGILMPDKWSPSQLKGSSVPISARKERIKTLPMRESVTSVDGKVTVTRFWNFYHLDVPKSKKQGGEYYLDSKLLGLVENNDFYTASGKMRAMITPENIEAVLDRLGELGVTLPSDRKVEFASQEEINTPDPIEAIVQASYAFHQDRGSARNEKELAEISDAVKSIPRRFGLKGGGITQVINSRSDLEQLKGKVSDTVYELIAEGYDKRDVTGLHISGSGIVVVFGEKVAGVEEAEQTWWHEQTHEFWHSLSSKKREEYGTTLLDLLAKYFPDSYEELKTGYAESEWKKEACSFFVENVINEYGADAFMTSNFGGNEISINFATELREFLRYGTRQQEQGPRGDNQWRGDESESRGSYAHRGNNLRQGRKGSRPLLHTQSELQGAEIADPIEVIEQSAMRWRRNRAEREGMTPEAHSAKAVYDERLNRVETVFSEAYQDAMVSLKTAQNAIAQDKEIPDSQNAYMAENLMHGKNKNEQDLYNAELRDPLIRTINKIMDETGMNWGDVDRYVYTKSGLERNREFFVRDFLERERNKRIRKYEDLDPAAQGIYDSMAVTIEEMFEDGDIASEEDKQKKLSQALQKAHDEYISELETYYQRMRSERYAELASGVLTFQEYLNAIDEFIRERMDGGYDSSEHDYSGFRAMFGDEDGKYDEAEIIAEVMGIEDGVNGSDGLVETLWEQINAATRYGLERYREAGMRSDEQIDALKQMFHWYVPMRGFAAETGEDMYQYFTGKGKAKSYVGGLLKHARGRGSEASYPISTIFAMSYKAIADCNQNLVNQKLYRLCQANPNDLIVLSDSWARLNETTGEWEEVGPDISGDMNEDEIREATLAWEESMRQMASAGKARKITGKAKFDYRPMDKKNKSEHIVDVRINGQPRKMIVTGNPRMAQALNGQLRFERGKNVFSKWNAGVKNVMASLFTSYSPTFALRNMMRDWTHFRMMLGVREGEGYARQANKYYRQSLFKMVGLFKKYREGTLDESKEIERDFKDFMDSGGITGFVQMQKIDDIQKQMEKLYKQQKDGKAVQLNNKLWDYTLGAIEAVNEGIENNARFATFRASRHYAGRTKARSSYDAKEITVNFNRKGAGGKTAGFKSSAGGSNGKNGVNGRIVEDAAKAFGVTSQLFGEGRIFFNATVQAIATTFKNFQNADGSLNKGYIAKWAARYALPPFMFGMALPMINKALASAFGGDGDDDPYANLAEWTRRRNICIYIGNNNFITIPIGQELAAFLTLGDIFAGYSYAPDLKPVDRGIDHELLDVMNTFSPVDISTKITRGGITEDPISEVTGRTFSVLAPLVAVEQNLGWTGRPVYREDRFQNDEYTPEYQMVYGGTNPVLVNASKLLHEMGGGDDVTRGKLEVNPAIIQYLWEQYTGGPGKVFSNTISIGKDAKDLFVDGESLDFNIRKVEGLKAFVQQGDDRTAYYRTLAKYRKYKEDADKLYHDVKGYGNGAAENPEYLLKLEEISRGKAFVRMELVREADKQLSKINKAANKSEGKEKRDLRRLYNEQVAEVVELLDGVR